MASDAKNLTIFNNYSQQKILTKLSYWVYIYLGEIHKYCLFSEKAVFSEVGARHPYQICKKNEKI
jgi:hypothetical protein